MPAVEAMSSTPTTNKAETTKSLATLEELLKALSLSKAQDEANKNAQNVAALLNGPIEEHAVPEKAVETFQKQLANKKDAVVRERALDGIKAIAQHATITPAFEPYLISLLPLALAAIGDKMTSVKAVAQETAIAIVRAINPNATKATLPHIRRSIITAQKWPEKITGLDCIEYLCESAPTQLTFLVPTLLPIVSESMWDTKPEVKKKAYGTMEKLCKLIENKDIEKFIPELIKCIAKPENVPETVHLLGATTFVSDVHEPALALMVPLLERGLGDRETAIKRKAAVIVDNMCKLVEDPQIVAAFLPKLMPALIKNFENMADPEAREKTKQGLETLKRVGAVKEDGSFPEISNAGEMSTVSTILKTLLLEKHKQAATNDAVVQYVSAIAGQLIDQKMLDAADWAPNVKQYIEVLVGDDAEAITQSLRLKAAPGAEEEATVEPDEEEGEDLCNCTFNLAYGAKILLNNTHFRLKRGQRYGLLGPNGSGKTTLMRAINNEQVEGFPKQSEVKTVFVEHDLDAADTEMSVTGWTSMKLEQVKIQKSKEEIYSKLQEFGFNEEQLNAPITSLSGGWKMKLALARA